MVSVVNPDLTHDLFQAAGENPRYANVRLGAVVEHINQGEQTQFAAATFQLPDGHKRRKPTYKARWLFPSAAPMIRSSDGRKISIWLSSIRCRRNVQPAPIWIWWRDCGRVRLFWSAIPREAIWRFTRP